MKDFVSGILTLLFGGFVLAYSRNFARPGSGMAEDPAFYPCVFAVILCLLGLALLVQSWKKVKTDKMAFDKTIFINVGKILVILLAYVTVLVPLGFILSTLAFIFAGILVFGGKLKTSLTLFVPITAVVYVAFSVLFRMPLPTGVLPF